MTSTPFESDRLRDAADALRLLAIVRDIAWELDDIAAYDLACDFIDEWRHRWKLAPLSDEDLAPSGSLH